MPIVLIVDADPSQRALVRASLGGDPSLIFLEASDDTQAFHLAAVYQPDTIIFDLCGSTPRRLHGLDPRQAARIMRSTPVIFTATWSHTNRTLTSVLTSGRPVLFKPFDAADLQAAVRHALRRTRLSARVS